MTYQLSLKVERVYIITPPFTNDDLPNFTEGRRKRNIIESSFTDDELPTSLRVAKR